MSMEIFKTDAGLGYNQYCIILRLHKNKNGYNYLIIDRDHSADGYEIGAVYEDLEDFYLEETDYKIEQSPIYNDFLFQQFIKHKPPTTEQLINEFIQLIETQHQRGENPLCHNIMTKLMLTFKQFVSER